MSKLRVKESFTAQKAQNRRGEDKRINIKLGFVFNSLGENVACICTKIIISRYFRSTVMGMGIEMAEIGIEKSN